MSQQIVVPALPACDICEGPARYDCATRMGPWAYLCVEDWPLYRATPNLGTGFGQRMVLPDEGERIKDNEPLTKEPWTK